MTRPKDAPNDRADDRCRDRTERTTDQGIVRDSRGQEQPKDKSRAQQSSGDKAQQDAAREGPPSPGQPAGGE